MYGNRQAATKEGPTATCQLSICHIEMYRSNRADYTKHFQISWNGKYTYIWEYSMLNTCWSWENYRPTTVYYMKNASLDIFLLSKHPQWKKKKCICIPLLDFCFISWARLPPVEGARVATPMEEAQWLHWRRFGHATPAAYCHQPFLGRQRLIRTVVARTIDLANVPTWHLCWHSQKGAEMPFTWISFVRPCQKRGDISPYSSLFLSNLIPKTWSLTRSQEHEDLV